MTIAFFNSNLIDVILSVLSYNQQIEKSSKKVGTQRLFGSKRMCNTFLEIIQYFIFVHNNWFGWMVWKIECREDFLVRLLIKWKQLLKE